MTTSASKNQKDFGKFLKAEIKNIEVDKWFAGCDLKTDPGQEYIVSWIATKGKKFRDKWDNSICKNCANWNNGIPLGKICCLQMLDKCEGYIPEENGEDK